MGDGHRSAMMSATGKLIIHQADAERVRSIFKRFVQLNRRRCWRGNWSVAGAKNRYGPPARQRCSVRLLNNRVYIGKPSQGRSPIPVSTKPLSTASSGTRPIPFSRKAPVSVRPTAAQTAGTAEGSLLDLWRRDVPDPSLKGAALPATPQPKRHEAGTECLPGQTCPAADIEAHCLDQLRSLLQTPEVMGPTCQPPARPTRLAPRATSVALLAFEPLWNELSRLAGPRCRAAVERVDLQPDGIDLRLRV